MPPRDPHPPLRLDADGWLITDDRRAERYEARHAGAAAPSSAVAFAAYRRDGGTIELWHTEVPPALSGHGLGSRLARAALDDVRARGLRVAPTCPFIAGYLRRHPAYHDLIAPEHRGRFAAVAPRGVGE